MKDLSRRRGPGREKSRLTDDRENALNRLLRDEMSPRADPGYPEMERVFRGSAYGNRLRLQIRNGRRSWTEDCRDAGLIRVGRGQDNNVIVDSRFCSRRQFELFVKNDGYYLRNLSRTNPTMVFHQGKRLTAGEVPVKLDDGDQIRVGDTRFLVDIIWESTF